MHTKTISFFIASYFILFTLAAPPPNLGTEAQDKNTVSPGGPSGYGGSFSIAGPGSNEQITQGGTSTPGTATYIRTFPSGGFPLPDGGVSPPVEGTFYGPGGQVISGGQVITGGVLVPVGGGPLPEEGTLYGPGGQVIGVDPLAPSQGDESLELVSSGPSGTSVQGNTF